jgi:hypothetical protein
VNAIEVAQNNFNSWNRHDAEAIVAAYAEGGTYRTPRMGQGQAIYDANGRVSSIINWRSLSC